jgi:hypothetical protein
MFGSVETVFVDEIVATGDAKYEICTFDAFEGETTLFMTLVARAATKFEPTVPPSPATSRWLGRT